MHWTSTPSLLWVLPLSCEFSHPTVSFPTLLWVSSLYFTSYPPPFIASSLPPLLSHCLPLSLRPFLSPSLSSPPASAKILLFTTEETVIFYIHSLDQGDLHLLGASPCLCVMASNIGFPWIELMRCALGRTKKPVRTNPFPWCAPVQITLVHAESAN